jgi:uncharacterized membrane protein HdeD (DUF308 family)
MIIEALKRNWWVPVIRGICGIIFGLIAFAYPGLTLATLVIFFGAWVLVDGIFRVVGAIAGRASDPDWGLHLVIGILGIVVGVLTFRAPAITALALIIYIAAWALMIGAAEIALAIKLRKEIRGEWLLILMGLLSIVFAVLLLWNPVPGALALLWAHRILRDRVRHSGNHFWVPIAQPGRTAWCLTAGGDAWFQPVLVR